MEKSGNKALLGRGQAAASLGAVVPDLVSFTREPAVMLVKRDALARAIVEMQQARPK